MQFLQSTLIQAETAIKKCLQVPCISVENIDITLTLMKRERRGDVLHHTNLKPKGTEAQEETSCTGACQHSNNWEAKFKYHLSAHKAISHGNLSC